MKLFNLAFKRETATAVLPLLCASGISVLLIGLRMAWTGDFHYVFLAWNLFLAWLPLAFALLAYDAYQNGGSRSWRFLGFATTWLLFFPNAPYICTDIIHLTKQHYSHFWIDLVLVLLNAFIGLVLGFVSLFLMQTLVTRRFGRAASWLFIAAVAGLSGFGIYLGRFLRFNSWDVLWKPIALYRGIGNWAADPLAHPTSVVFPPLFATFLFLAYLMLYGLTHLQQMQPATNPRLTARPQDL
jgi:uncharacterized membrane protein